MKLNVKNEQGFTLVELMVVVAIIGVLSAVAIPNFKKYQAKAKTSEAKVQLAAAYTAEQAFYADFGMYAACLDYMGYDPSNEINSRYYAVGFRDGSAINIVPLTSAQNSGLGVACVTAAPSGVVGAQLFPAGKTVGGAAALATVAAANTDLGTQATGLQTFTISAEGVISTDGATATTSSVFTMNENKVMSNVRAGY